MDRIDVAVDGHPWLVAVPVAAGVLPRARGLLASPPSALLLRTRSVHGFWLRRPVRVVCLDPAGVVLDVAILRRRRIVWVPGTRWVLELPVEVTPPPTGAVLTWGDQRGEPVGDGRSTGPVLNPDRQPR